MENNKIYATVNWYDPSKNYGIASYKNTLLFIHQSYFENPNEILFSNDAISCTPLFDDGIYHAMNIEKINTLKDKTDLY